MSVTTNCIGDIGIYDNDVRQIIKQMAKHRGTNFVTLLGDNFYPYGIQDERQWQAYLDTFNCIKSPVLPILGNHDYVGDIRSQRHSNYWSMADYYYCRIYKNVGFWFLDTQILDPGDPKDPNIFMNMWKPIQKFHGSQAVAANCQLTWLRNSLERHKGIKHKVIFGHYPLFTCGIHGDNLVLIKNLLPIFKKYKINAYVSGHDHNVQHIQREITTSYTLNQFIVGCSSDENAYKYKTKDHGCKYFNIVPSYLNISATSKSLTFKIFNKTGTVIYQF